MTWWPRSLLSRLLMIVLLGLLLANSLTLSLLMYERISSARSVMLGNLEYDVATSVAILDRLPAAERPMWLNMLGRGNYHYLLSTGQSGEYPTAWRSKDTAHSLEAALGTHYALKINAIPGPQEHLQAHLQLKDGQPLTIDVKPRLTPIANWLPFVLCAQLALLLICSWFAVRQAVRPLTVFTHAIESLDPTTLSANPMAENGPAEVRYAARAFNAMQARIKGYLKERAQILAAISHDLQTPITRMKLRAEMADQPELRDKLLLDLEEMTHLVREGIAYARASENLEEKFSRIDLNAFIDSVVCDYVDVGKRVSFTPAPQPVALINHPQALRRILTNLIDNALKFAGSAELVLNTTPHDRVEIVLTDTGPGIPAEELEAVLQPFYRVESSRNRETGGTGLGLAITQQLVQQLRGQLWLVNREPQGLEVRIHLPTAR